MTRADLSQVFKSIDPRVMSIPPLESDRVVSNLEEVLRLKRGRGKIREGGEGQRVRFKRHALPLTEGTGAGFS